MDTFAPITTTTRVDYFPRKISGRGGNGMGRMHHLFNSSALISSAVKSHMNGTGLSLICGGEHDVMKNPEEQKKVSQSDKKYRALHIEDDEEIRFLVKAFLKEFVEVDPAADGYEALNYTSEHKYDLIITDINLGAGIDGIEASREIRNMNYYQDVPIIAATANGTSEIRNQCIKVGMDAFLLKPFMKNDLINTIEQVMEDRLQ